MSIYHISSRVWLWLFMLIPALGLLLAALLVPQFALYGSLQASAASMLQPLLVIYAALGLLMALMVFWGEGYISDSKQPLVWIILLTLSVWFVGAAVYLYRVGRKMLAIVLLLMGLSLSTATIDTASTAFDTTHIESPKATLKMELDWFDVSCEVFYSDHGRYPTWAELAATEEASVHLAVMKQIANMTYQLSEDQQHYTIVAELKKAD